MTGNTTIDLITTQEPAVKVVADQTLALVERMIVSPTTFHWSKQNGCREIMKHMAIDIKLLLLDCQLLTDHDPTIVPSLPDPVKQMEYLPKTNFLSWKICIPESHKRVGSMVVIKSIQVICKSVKESLVLPGQCQQENVVVMVEKGGYVKTENNLVEGVVKEMEVEPACLVVIGHQTDMFSIEQWNEFSLKFEENLIAALLCHNNESIFEIQRVISNDKLVSKHLTTEG